MPDRFTPRADDKWWQTFFAFLIRAPKAAKTMAVVLASLGIGSIVSVSIHRFLVLDKVLAQDANHSGRMTSIENAALILREEQNQLRAKVDALASNTGMLVKRSCLETSKADQELIGMDCPANLYRGVPR
jgi:hypothetical protein